MFYYNDMNTSLTATISYSGTPTFPVLCEWRLKSVRSSSSEAAPGLSILFPSTRTGAPDTCSSANKPWGGGTEEGNIIGTGLGEPHTSRLNGGFLIFRYYIAGNIGGL